MSDNLEQNMQVTTDINASSGLFKGRMGRASLLARFIPLMILGIILRVISTVAALEYGNQEIPILILIISIPLTIYILSCYVKRWHDMDKSGWMVLTLFIPLANIIILLLLLILPGTEGINRFGPAPN